MLSLYFLSITLSNTVFGFRYVALIGSPIICVKAINTKRLQQFLQLKKNLVFSVPKNIRKNLPCIMTAIPAQSKNIV